MEDIGGNASNTDQTVHLSQGSATLQADNKSSSTVSPATVPTDFVADDSLGFMLIPLGVLLGILILSAMVFLMVRNRRRWAHVYCKQKAARRQLHSYLDDESDSALEQMEPNDGDDYDFDDPSECLLKGKLQIDNQRRYETYQTTQVTADRELYT